MSCKINSHYADIINCIGLKYATDLANYFGGDFLYIPKDDQLKRYDRNKHIINLAGRKSVNELSSLFNLSSRHIRTILNVDNRVVESESFKLLQSVIGSDMTKVLCEKKGGNTIYIPLATSFKRAINQQ